VGTEGSCDCVTEQTVVDSRPKMVIQVAANTSQ
jgi:hypothetical protein